jgi:hypothetical protein
MNKTGCTLSTGMAMTEPSAHALILEMPPSIKTSDQKIRKTAKVLLVLFFLAGILIFFSFPLLMILFDDSGTSISSIFIMALNITWPVLVPFILFLTAGFAAFQCRWYKTTILIISTPIIAIIALHIYNAWHYRLPSEGTIHYPSEGVGSQPTRPSWPTH